MNDMTPDPTIDQRIAAWLTSEAPSQMPDRVLAATFATTRTTPQVGWLPGRRSLRMRSMPAAIAAGAVAILVLALAGVAIIGSPNGVASPSPATSSAPSATASATAIGSAAPVLGLGLDATETIVFRQQIGDGRDVPFAMAPDTSGRRKLADTSVCCLAVEPRAGRIAIAGSEWATPVIVDLAGHRIEGPWEPPEGHLSLAPRVFGGPDGFDLAMEGSDDASPRWTGVWLSLSNGGGGLVGDLRQLTTSPEGKRDIPIAFSPAGDQLLFVRQDDQHGDLFLVELDRAALKKDGYDHTSTKMTQLNPPSTSVTADDFFGSPASYSPDGKTIAFAAFDTRVNNGLANVYVSDLSQPTLRTEPVASGVWTTSAHFSPDGRSIAFDREGPGGPHDLFLINPDGSGERNLTANFAPGVCCTRWSPDGRRLLGIATSTDDTHNELYVYAVDGSAPIQLTNEPGMYRSYTWLDASP